MSWTRRLLGLLDGPDGQQAARLIALFASPSEVADLTAVVTDPARDPWVRRYLLRAFEARALPLDPSARTALDDLAEAATLEAIEHPTYAVRRPSPPVRAIPEHGALGDLAQLERAGAISPLLVAAATAPHVVLRARAIRALVGLRPTELTALCKRALADRECFAQFYAPVVSEAALGLARHPSVDEHEALEALVEAGLQLSVDDAWWAIAAAIGSWVDHRPATIQPVWYERY